MNTKNMFRLLLISAVLLGFSSVTHAIPTLPTLNFSGDLVYTAGTGELTLNGSLQTSSSIITPIDFGSSTISLSTTFDTSVSAGGATTGYFGVGTINIDDMTTGSDSLLTADFTEAQMLGADGAYGGFLTLELTPTSGTLMSYFSDPSDLFALTLYLSTPFGEGMFDSNFSGIGNGYISSRKAVYEPGVLSLFMLGVVLIGISGWRRQRLAG